MSLTGFAKPSAKEIRRLSKEAGINKNYANNDNSPEWCHGGDEECDLRCACCKGWWPRCPLHCRLGKDQWIDNGVGIPATRGARGRSWRCGFCWIFTIAVSAAVLMFLCIMIGSAVEKPEWSEINDVHTEIFYTPPSSCAIDKKDGNSFFQQFDSSSTVAYNTAKDAGYNVAHCGNCGACSTEQDLVTYQKTAATFGETMVECAAEIFTGGVGSVSDCIDEKFGFSSRCRQCYLNDVICTRDNCLWTCMKEIIIGEPLSTDGTASDCHLCSQRICGIDFINCAGASAERAGHMTDITFNPSNTNPPPAAQVELLGKPCGRDNSGQDVLEFDSPSVAFQKGTCEDKDFKGNAVSDSDCGPGWVYDATKASTNCSSNPCETGTASSADQTCCKLSP